MLRLFLLFVVSVFAAFTPANAAWREASSDHFVVVADDSEKDIRAFTERLERYHAAMASIFADTKEAPSPSNRVTIYIVRNAAEVRKLLGVKSRNVVGFYVPRAGGSVAFTPQIKGGSARELDWSMRILLHEYAHHYLISASSFAMPRWMSEGGAEFFSSAGFKPDGAVDIGLPAKHRAGELYHDGGLDVEEMFAPEVDSGQKNYDSFYGKSWLLYHYLVFSDERRGQMKKYGEALRDGKSSLDAAKDAFGDLDQLDKDLDSYLRQRRLYSLVLAANLLKVGPVSVRQLSEGEAEMVPLKIRSKRGVDREQALDLLADARKVAARYPADPAVLTALAEAEYDAGFSDKAIAAADAALAIDPAQVNAYVQKGYAMFAMAKGAEDRSTAYNDAIKPFVALNKIENNHPLPLIYYYRSFVESGRKPPELAVRGLDRAAQLAPFDLTLHFMLAMQDLRDGDKEQARANLIPVAYNPHGGHLAQPARFLLTKLDEGTDAAVLAVQAANMPDMDEPPSGEEPGGEKPGGGEPGGGDGETGDE